MVSLFFGNNQFEELIDRATSELLPAGHEDLALNLEICDQIRSKQVNAREAMRSLKRRIEHKNPNVQLLALTLTDTCVKNGGLHFLVEIASREFMDCIGGIVRSLSCNAEVKQKILSCVQNWGIAAKEKPQLSYISEIYQTLKHEGFVFPPPSQADAIMLDSEAPPEWSDSDVCERCRTPFTFTNRKHHCRACGKTICHQCSTHNLALPHLGITQEVRVCDTCYAKKKIGRQSYQRHSPQIQIQSSSSTRNQATPAPASEEDEDLKRAIELSLKEAERKKGYTPSPSRVDSKPSQPNKAEEESDPDLAAAIAASLQDMNAQPQYKSTSSYSPSFHNGPSQLPSNDLQAIERENLELFCTVVDRIKESGGDIMSDYHVQALYDQMGSMRTKLAMSLDEAVKKHGRFVQLHERVNKAVKLYDNLLEQRLTNAYNRHSLSHSVHPLPSPPVVGGDSMYSKLVGGSQILNESIYPRIDASAPYVFNQPTGYPQPQPQPQPQQSSTPSSAWPSSYAPNPWPGPTPQQQPQQSQPQLPHPHSGSYYPSTAPSALPPQNQQQLQPQTQTQISHPTQTEYQQSYSSPGYDNSAAYNPPQYAQAPQSQQQLQSQLQSSNHYPHPAQHSAQVETAKEEAPLIEL
ncbi:uncharacterized protein VTP21DRAFT_5114 [Calcarisporiella thermophila]|uniref:uncharacterized protein n=1 Tax=Calcarisporiella thermophila TaxID=911321 RepID=UPI0037435929